MITCAEAVRQLWEFLDRALPDEDHEAIEAHLVFCRRCCGELEFARELRRFLERHRDDEVPADVQHRLEGFLAGLADQAPGDGEAPTQEPTGSESEA